MLAQHWSELPTIYTSDDLRVVAAENALPAHPSEKVFDARPEGQEIKHIFLHHTAGRVKKGLTGIRSTHAYCQRPKRLVPHVLDEGHWISVGNDRYEAAPKNLRRMVNLGGRGWAGIPYHLWIPYLAENDESERLIVYLLNPIDRWTWHTGGKDDEGISNNMAGIGVAMQGFFASNDFPNPHPPDGAQITTDPSPKQHYATYLALTWLVDTYCSSNADVLSTHSRAGTGSKPSCPGWTGEILIDGLRATWRPDLPPNSPTL